MLVPPAASRRRAHTGTGLHCRWSEVLQRRRRVEAAQPHTAQACAGAREPARQLARRQGRLVRTQQSGRAGGLQLMQSRLGVPAAAEVAAVDLAASRPLVERTLPEMEREALARQLLIFP